MKGTTQIQEIEELMNKGFDAAYSADFDNAIEIGKSLIKLKHSSGFEILALGYQGKEKLRKAIATLEKGTKIVTDVFKMWQLLGNLYSDDCNFKKAYASYEKGMKCPNSDINSLLLNWSVALERDGKTQEAYQKLTEIEPGECDMVFNLSYWATKFRVQNGLEQFEKTIDEFRRVQTAVDFKTDEGKHLSNLKEFISNFYCEYALALWKTHENNEIQEFIQKALAADKHNERLKWLIREIRNSKTDSSYHYHIMIKGKWALNKSPEGKGMDFFTNYGVIAESVDEALEFIREFEPKEIRHQLQIEELEKISRTPNKFKGVYNTSGYHIFVRDVEK